MKGLISFDALHEDLKEFSQGCNGQILPACEVHRQVLHRLETVVLHALGYSLLGKTTLCHSGRLLLLLLAQVVIGVPSGLVLLVVVDWKGWGLGAEGDLTLALFLGLISLPTCLSLIFSAALDQIGVQF